MGRPDGETGRAGAPGPAAGRGGGPAGPPGRGPVGGVAGRAAGGGPAGRGPDGGSGRAATDGARLVSPGVGRVLTIRRGSSASGAGGGATGGASTSASAAAGSRGAGGSTTFGASTGGAGFITGGVSTTGSSTSGAETSAAFFAGAFLAGAFFAGLASSGCSARVRPSRSARRRSRSACASMIDDDWLLASTPIVLHRFSNSVLVIPSSLASSCTRIFLVGKLIQPFVGDGTPARCPAARDCLMSSWVVTSVPSSASMAAASTGRRHARANPPRRAARAAQSAAHTHAPRPGAVRLVRAEPSAARTQRHSSRCGRVERHPIQVRSGSRSTGSGVGYVATLHVR